MMPVLAAVAIFSLYSCEDDGSDKLTGSNPAGNAVDVSNRITGVSPESVGGGSTITLTGSNLGDVELIRLGESTWISDYEATDSSIELVVPSFAPIGMNDLKLIFPGNDRADVTFEVIPNPSITYYTPKAASDGQEVTVLGNNLSFVSAISVGGTDATINSVTDSQLSFTMPSGASSGAIVMTTSSGSTIESESEIIACTADAGSYECLTVVNTNGSFEESALGAADGVNGWGGLNGSLATGEITDKDPYDGFNCVKITVNDIGANPWNIQPFTSFPVDPTATYRVSIMAKGTGIVSADFATDEGGSPGYGRYDGQSPGEVEVQYADWTEISWEVSPSSEATSSGGDESTRFAISLSYADNIGGTIYLDNLRVVKVN